MAQDAIFYPDPAPFEPPNKLPPSAFTTGSQPPRIAQVAALTAAILSASWPQANEPQLHQQNLAPRKIAPLTLTYGQQPPGGGPITPIARAISLSWVSGSWDAQSASESAAWDIPAVVASQVPFTRQHQAVAQAWAVDPVIIIPLAHGAPLFPVHGDEPPRVGAITSAEFAQLIGSWAPSQAAQPFPRYLVQPPAAPAANDPPPFRALARAILDAWIPPAPLPAKRPQFTPPTATDTPAPRQIARLLGQLRQSWEVEPRIIKRGPFGAPWDFVSVVNDPPRLRRFPNSILLAWQPSLAFVRPVRIAPLVGITVTVYPATLMMALAELRTAIAMNDVGAAIALDALSTSLTMNDVGAAIALDALSTSIDLDD